ncbi:MAG: membrane-associated protein, partial [Hymenobacteraceae bacterium]|nr:membrane-associated protein [Hymenobacteraceae bacterium]
DTRAIYWQKALAWVVLPLNYFHTHPQQNLNWVLGPGNQPQQSVSSDLYFAGVMLFFPLVIFLPSHFLLKWLCN